MSHEYEDKLNKLVMARIHQEQHIRDCEDATRKAKEKMAEYNKSIAALLSSQGVVSDKAGDWRVSIVPARGSVIIDDDSAVPDEYMRKSPDKVRLHKLMTKEGLQVNWGRIEYGEPSIRITRS